MNDDDLVFRRLKIEECSNFLDEETEGGKDRRDDQDGGDGEEGGNHD